MKEIPTDIIIEASKGDLDAFKAIYDLSCGYVYNIAYRIMGYKEDAEEVTQDVYLKIYKNLKHFRFRSKIKTWIHRIAVNTAINAYKRRSSKFNKKTSFNEEVLNRPAREIIKERIDKEENEILVRRLLKILNPQQRSCVILRDMEGLSYKEIADTLKVNINTVRSRLKRARLALFNAVQKGVI